MQKSILFILFYLFSSYSFGQEQKSQVRHTHVSISGNKFLINDRPTLEGRIWNGYPLEGLLPNARLVQGIFDDENPATVQRFGYPDTQVWDPDRNTDEFIAAMPSWHAYGLLAFTLNMQGGSPIGYGNKGWINSAFDPSGLLKPDCMQRLERILDRTDELGMVVILGLFYFGQDEILKDESACIAAVQNTISWLFDKGYRHILIEIANENDVNAYDHEIIKPARAHELILLVKNIQVSGYSYPVSTSFKGNTVPSENVISASDYILFHGNGVQDPDRMKMIIREIRALPSYRSQPIVCNEDDHYDFEKDVNNFTATLSEFASWGLFDYRREGEPFEEGFQTVPVDWTISSARKKAFFQLLKEITGK